MSVPEKQKRLPSYAILDEEAAQGYEQLTHQGVYDLLPTELFWQARQPFLYEHGYQLRPRYSPNWDPSWKGTRLDPTFCEDSIMLVVGNYQVIDARKLKDNKLVAIKQFRNDTQEARIAQFLSSITDPLNHCVTIHEVLSDPFDPQLSLMVMPYLRPCRDPDFATIGDVVDFVNQTLEGLVFMHRHNVAHRDIAVENIMMDAASLYPGGHHPVRRHYTPDGLYEVTPLPRGDHSVTYLYVDFGLSSWFPGDASPYVVGRVGRDKQAPELSSTVPYNAFKLDIFTLGNLYSQEFEQRYNGMQFLIPLIDNMRQPRPELRPTAAQLLAQWEEIKADLKESLFRWRLGPKTEPAVERVLNDTVAIAREGIYHLRKFVR
ncbi:kinase-like domain-containing protein [Cubamyces lactineus]|nr:kinase-like domain-containing protein [Cubamyces lactineus]